MMQPKEHNLNSAFFSSIFTPLAAKFDIFSFLPSYRTSSVFHVLFLSKSAFWLFVYYNNVSHNM